MCRESHGTHSFQSGFDFSAFWYLNHGYFITECQSYSLGKTTSIFILYWATTKSDTGKWILLQHCPLLVLKDKQIFEGKTQSKPPSSHHSMDSSHACCHKKDPIVSPCRRASLDHHTRQVSCKDQYIIHSLGEKYKLLWMNWQQLIHKWDLILRKISTSPFIKSFCKDIN